MSDATRQIHSQDQIHSQELQVAVHHIAQGKKLIARQQAIARDLRWAGGTATQDAEILLRLLEDTQRMFEKHADMLRRELREPQGGPGSRTPRARRTSATVPTTEHQH